MQKTFAITIAILSLFAIVVQFLLMMENRVASIGETTMRFFSYFTILTNMLVAAYFSYSIFRSGKADSTSTLTTVTVYITVVGLVYQVVLRQLWEPTGWQRIVDELLHTINPLLVLIYWSRYGTKVPLRYSQVFAWLLYPALYLILILMRGAVSGFYPYPFLDVSEIGYSKTLINCAFVTLLLLLIACFFIYIGRRRGGNVRSTNEEPLHIK